MQHSFNSLMRIFLGVLLVYFASGDENDKQYVYHSNRQMKK